MRTAKTASGKPIWTEWHEGRRMARSTFMNEEEATDYEQVAFDIDEDDPAYPLGGLPSEMRDENYIVEDPVSGKVYDYRDVHPTI